jgi:hypothetical protein
MNLIIKSVQLEVQIPVFQPFVRSDRLASLSLHLGLEGRNRNYISIGTDYIRFHYFNVLTKVSHTMQNHKLYVDSMYVPQFQSNLI